MASRILIVEDEPELADALKSVLIAQGHVVIGPAPDCSSALELLWRERPDIAFVDTHLGSDTCEAVLDECDQQMVSVIVTTTEPIGLPKFCGVRKSLNKPIDEVGLRDIAL